MASSMRNIIIVIIIAIAVGGIAFVKMGVLDREPSLPDTGETTTTGGEEPPTDDEDLPLGPQNQNGGKNAKHQCSQT